MSIQEVLVIDPPEGITTLEDFIRYLKPKTIFFGYEGFSEDEMPNNNKGMEEEYQALCKRIREAHPKAKFTSEPLYLKLVKSDYFTTKFKYIFTNPKAKWEDCINADLALVYNCEGEWLICRAEGYKPYTYINIE